MKTHKARRFLVRNKTCYISLFLGLLIIGFSSCKTATPQIDFGALVDASRRMGVEIEYTDNQKLYLEGASWIGVPYRNGGNTKKGIDCSGFTKQVFSNVYSLQLERTTGGQKKQTKKIAKRNLKEGDLVFFSSPNSRGKLAHVGIYLKDDLFIHASTSRGVIVSNLKSQYYKKHWLYGGRI